MDETDAMALPRGALRDRAMLTLVGYVVALILAEACVAYWNVSVGALLEGALLLLLVNQYLVSQIGDSARSSIDNRATSAEAALALAFVPLVQLLSLSMAVGEVSPGARYVIVGAPVLAAGLLAVALGPFEEVALELAAWSWRVQGPICLLGIPLGLAAFAVAGRPDGLIENDDWALLAVWAVLLVVFTGFPEELLFRGVLQTGLTPVFGPASPAVAALLFGATYLAVGSAEYAGFAAVVGFGFGVLVRRTGSLLGVSIAHGLMNVGLLLVWPLVLQ